MWPVRPCLQTGREVLLLLPWCTCVSASARQSRAQCCATEFSCTILLFKFFSPVTFRPSPRRALEQDDRRYDRRDDFDRGRYDDRDRGRYDDRDRDRYDERERGRYATSMPASPAACIGHHYESPYRSACLQQFNETKQRDLEALLEACEWQRLEFKPFHVGCNMRRASPGKEPCSGSDGNEQIMHGLTEATMRPIAATDARVERCGHASNDHEWEVHRIGPLTTTGGNDWTQVQLPALHSRHAPGTRLAISEVLFRLNVH